MAYETKVLLMALAQLAARANSAEEVYEAIAEMANVEGMILKPFDEARTKAKVSEK